MIVVWDGPTRRCGPPCVGAALPWADVADSSSARPTRWARAGRASCWSPASGGGPTCAEPAAAARPTGDPLPRPSGAFAAAATVAGIVALPDRAALVATAGPAARGASGTARRRASRPAERAVVGRGARRRRRSRTTASVKRALFAAARAARATPGWTVPDDDDGRPLRRWRCAGSRLRDAVWLAVDERPAGRRGRCGSSWPGGCPRPTTRRRCSCTAGRPGAPATARWRGIAAQRAVGATRATRRPTCCSPRCRTGSTRDACPGCAARAGTPGRPSHATGR